MSTRPSAVHAEKTPQSERFILSSTPSFNAEQLAAARRERWHQGGDALLTLEAAREWVNEAGLVLFAPRAHQLPMPAPSLVEATLGRAVNAPTAAETETARGLLARMVADGAVVPLNLLSGPGDVPDFVVSAQMFSYVFTLRGDKSWKQPPSTSGAVKVSPLALKVYEALEKGNALTAAELADELGRELTENAIARALSELWAQMRVIPLLQQDGAATMWELTARRFTKQIKAGANAGQPTALSALISVYLAQVFVATEEEIETFLSPLSARSRTRDVLHGLTAARQLENVVLEGKTLLYIPGALPEFPEIEVEVVAEGDGETAAAAAGAVIAAAATRPERIRRFDGARGGREERGQRGARPVRPEGGERPARPFRREAGERTARPAGGDRGERRGPARPFGERRERGAEGKGKSFGDRERRPFQRERAEGGGERREGRSFTRPWDEERKPRPRREEGERREGGRPFRKEGESAGRESRGKSEFRGKPAFGGSKYGKGPKKEFGARPRREGAEGGERGERPFRPRREGEGGERPFRPRREGEGGQRPFRPRSEGGREGFGTRPQKRFRPRPEGEGGERPFRPRREGEGGERPFRPRREGDRERTEGRSERPFRRRDEGQREGAPKRPYRSAEGGERSRPGGERRAGGKPGGKPGFGGKPKFGAKRGPGGRTASEGGGKGKFGERPKSGARERNVRAKDMRGGKKGERAGGTERPRRETEE